MCEAGKAPLMVLALSPPYLTTERRQLPPPPAPINEGESFSSNRGHEELTQTRGGKIGTDLNSFHFPREKRRAPTCAPTPGWRSWG